MKFFFKILLLILTSHCSLAQIVINEMMSLNESAFINDMGQYSDWIELYNTSDDSVQLSNFYLSDDRNDTKKWNLPQHFLAAKSYFIVFASDENSTLHTNFKISSEGETLFLSLEGIGQIDSLPPVALEENQAFGRFPDGSASMGFLSLPTPNLSNDSIQKDFSTLYFSHSSGFYDSPIALSISSSDSSAEIYYTSNGAEPTLSDLKYTSALELQDASLKENSISEIPTADNWQRPKLQIFKGHILKTAAFKNGVRISKIYTYSFFINPNMKNRYSFPLISLSTAPQNLFDKELGIYVKGENTNYSQRGRAWERLAQLEYFDREGIRQVNQQIGIRTNGNKGRTLAQKSLLIYARDSYGKKRLKHPFFKDKDIDSFKRIILRSASSNDWKNTLFKNELAQRIAIDLNFEHPATQEVIVFINGAYWGIHHLNERTDEYFIETYYDEENIDLLSHNAMVEEGSNSSFLSLKAYMLQNDLSQAIHYEYVSQRVDIDNLTDYYCAQLFFANTDWPNNNIKFWKKQEDGKWRWLFFDCDECMSYEFYDLMADLVNDKNSSQDFPEWSTFIIRNLLKNPSFRLAFRQRFEELLNNTFSTSNLIQHIDAMKRLYSPEVDEHCLRWGAPSNKTDWEEVVKGLYSFAVLRPQIMRQQLQNYFDNPFDIYPNPSHGNITVDAYEKMEVQEIKMYNTQGQEVYHEFKPTKNSFQFSKLKLGLYIVKLKCNDRWYEEKLIVQ